MNENGKLINFIGTYKSEAYTLIWGGPVAETMGRFLNFSGRVVSKVRIKSFMIN